MKLKNADPTIPGSEYINANYIRQEPQEGCPVGSEVGLKSYIATQGCLPSTVADLWSMVWQENVRVIVMTTKEIERGKNKCARYWPDENQTKDYGQIRVRSVSEVSNNDYTLRQFLVSSEENNEERTIYHYHFQASFHFFFFKISNEVYNYLVCFDRHGQTMECPQILAVYSISFMM